MTDCQCSSGCACRTGDVSGCACLRRLCPVLCRCRVKCLPPCRCAVPCLVLDAALHEVEGHRNQHIELLTKDGTIRDAPRHSPGAERGERDGKTPDREGGLVDLGAQLRQYSALAATFWDYRVVQGLSNTQIAELTCLNEITIRRMLAEAICQILAATDLTRTSQCTIVRCLRSGRKGGPRPRAQGSNDPQSSLRRRVRSHSSQ